MWYICPAVCCENVLKTMVLLIHGASDTLAEHSVYSQAQLWSSMAFWSLPKALSTLFKWEAVEPVVWETSGALGECCLCGSGGSPAMSVPQPGSSTDLRQFRYLVDPASSHMLLSRTTSHASLRVNGFLSTVDL